MVKPSIRKQDGRWLLTRPGYGFSARPSTSEHASWKAARQALLGDVVGSAGPIVERGHHTLAPLNDWGYRRHGTIRMEDNT